MPDSAVQFYPWAHVIGRALFSMVFILSGMNNLMKLNDMAAYAGGKGVPAPKVATALSGLMLVAGGIFVVIGWTRFIGAGLLVIFLVPTAFMMHPFWKEQDPVMRANETAHFMKDLALAGAALLVAYYAGWDWPMSVGG